MAVDVGDKPLQANGSFLHAAVASATSLPVHFKVSRVSLVLNRVGVGHRMNREQT
jgi:hypothetical protein